MNKMEMEMKMEKSPMIDDFFPQRVVRFLQDGKHTAWCLIATEKYNHLIIV